MNHSNQSSKWWVANFLKKRMRMRVRSQTKREKESEERVRIQHIRGSFIGFLQTQFLFDLIGFEQHQMKILDKIVAKSLQLKAEIVNITASVLLKYSHFSFSFLHSYTVSYPFKLRIWSSFSLSDSKFQYLLQLFNALLQISHFPWKHSSQDPICVHHTRCTDTNFYSHILFLFLLLFMTLFIFFTVAKE